MYFTVDGEGLTEVEYDWKNDKSWFGGERCFYCFASIYIYFSYNGGDEMLGIFVGLWAPTLILYAQELDKLSE